ncbi:MAG: tRNA-2-methylthio-N6-dimethylallyladenosine synthase [Lysobacterales bacterium]|jgi:tRNA-2-methylthio-N6-dimethylallyladenosine synthase
MDNTNNKKIFVETYGCQMNEYDTELVKSILQKDKFAFVKTEAEADVIMLNTCAIRENAHRKVYGRIHKIKHDRGSKPVKIGILGCMATNLRQELLDNKNIDIDFIAGPDSYKRLPNLIHESYQAGEKSFDVTLSEFETYSDITPSRNAGVNAWIAVMRGCNNFCTFCVVPYTRGRERSRSVVNVVEEAKKLAGDGFKQITLLGQNVNSYKHEGQDFADMIQAVSEVNGIERIRFTSPHPKDFPENLIQLIATNPKVCKQIHYPIQSGNDRVLDLMNRTYTKQEILDHIAYIRQVIPNIAFSTDIIVGFSSETDAEFEDTYDVMKQVEFDSAFIFKYSERKNTIASKKHPDDVPEAIKTERIVRLNELQRAITLKKNEAHTGEIHQVLVEKLESTKSKDKCFGRTDQNKIVVFPKADYKVGDFIDVRITRGTPSSLEGELV